jgi:metal-sulfur cluster biosynthetic enzyme
MSDNESTGAPTTTATAPSVGPTIAVTAADDAAVSPDQVKAALRRVKDPELNLNIVDLGLIYAINVEGSAVKVDMSLTSPGCPSGPEIMTHAEREVRNIPEVTDAFISLVWSPPWTPDRIEPRVKAYLGF